MAPELLVLVAQAPLATCDLLSVPDLLHYLNKLEKGSASGSVT